MNTYARKDVSFSHGEGAWLYDHSGKRYLDVLGGIAVCALGHAHPAVAQTICEQSRKLIHTSNIYRIEQQERLGERLCKLAKMEKAFFCNSGAEANEAAIKLARLYGHARGIKTPAVIVFERSFHGRTLATLTATGSYKAQAGFEPLVSGFFRAAYDDLESVQNICRKNKDLSAILVEPVQGEGGIRIPSAQFLKQLRALCDEHHLLLMFDEIQTGVGRSGHWYAAEHFAILPDVITSAKALGNGMPIGACMARGAAADLFSPGKHGTTFGGNPLACATALTVLDTIESEGLLENVAQNGAYFFERLQAKMSPLEIIKEIRSLGFLIGIELHAPCAPLVDIAMDRGLLINVTSENVIRLLPPYILTREQIDMAVQTLQECIEVFAQLQVGENTL